MLRCLSAGESHGKSLVAILEGLPAGLRVPESFINAELKRRQAGFGRGKRMQIENDRVEVSSGLKGGVSLGSPLTLIVRNRDFSIEVLHKVLCPRPGHADLAGFLKYGFSDVREVLERASARSTASTVAVGAVCKLLLKEAGIRIGSRVVSIGGVASPHEMRGRIERAIKQKDTVGGIFEVVAHAVPVGLGSYVQPDRRLDGRLAGALMAIPGIKAVEIGLGFGYASAPGSGAHDEIGYDRRRGYVRLSNNAGGIEGGISNGQPIVLRACIKPIATLMAPLRSVDLRTRRSARAAVERSDTCVVEAAGVVAEAACAFVLADALLEKFGQDNVGDLKRSLKQYLQRIR